MFIEDYLPHESLVVDSYEDACTIQRILLKNGNCVMMSREEALWVLTWIWTETPADRNEVIFIDRSNYECNVWNWTQNHPEYLEEGN